ncbi:hypothetical protein [Paremcibacter congregatus]|uniref:Yip1 domain-containing protein n=1 Tax=Paremcibacter congregatus TaxID=2043170 RepID=A0A2G4YWB9_9PROT|nr:hypothetical protein [Paremcibacter congregatus]PHZ86637.1 hypothetical protein CRD36_01820 [Paremcibacter congregatus]QDE26439.1 hypothetical protein FIV45_03695 [Paremcibacter congregatus]
MSDEGPQTPPEKQNLISYIGQSLAGAWQLVRLNPRAMDYFDTSAEGFWKSFWAIPVVAPIFFLSLQINFEPAVEQGHQVSLMAHFLNYLLQLPLVAIVMIFFTRFLRIEANYAAMIVAYNWLWALLNYIILPLSLLLTKDIVSVQVGGMIIAAAAIYLELFVAWFMFKQALKISTWLAIGVTAFESLFSLTVMQLLIRFV